jgi:hypothetical protein
MYERTARGKEQFETLIMTSARQEMIDKLERIWELSEDLRFGQLLANLGFLTEAETDQSLYNIEDDQLIVVMEKLEGDLSRRQES